MTLADKLMARLVREFRERHSKDATDLDAFCHLVSEGFAPTESEASELIDRAFPERLERIARDWAVRWWFQEFVNRGAPDDIEAFKRNISTTWKAPGYCEVALPIGDDGAVLTAHFRLDAC